jgi:hypothetical protein
VRRGRPPTTPPAASTAAIAAMKREESGDGDDGDGGDEEEEEEEESDDEMIASAEEELADLAAALHASPELRAAAPVDEVEGEILALQYELLWQQQANRSVLTNLLGRVAEVVDEEGEFYSKMEAGVSEAVGYMVGLCRLNQVDP